MTGNSEKEISRKKILILFIAVLLFFVGYFISPPSMVNGNYTGTVTYRHNNTSTTIEFFFTLNSSLNVPLSPQVITKFKNGSETFINAYQSYSGNVGNNISYTLTINDTENAIK